MKRQPEVIVIGVGTAGAAACMVLAQRGIHVLGLDARHPPHRRGSHHGRSRSVRRAYLEGSAYLPMAEHAWQGWRKLERDGGQKLLVTTGNLTIGLPDGPAVTGFLSSARSGCISHELLTAAEVRRRWPVLKPPDDFVAGLEIEAGIVFPERCIHLFLDKALRAGATLLTNEAVTSWSADEDSVSVTTQRGRYTAGRLLIAAGARNTRLFGPFTHLVSPKRVPVHWIDPPESGAYGLGRFPVNFWQVPLGGEAQTTDVYREFYSLPAMEAGGPVKAAFHNGLEDCDPETPPMPVTREETAAIQTILSQYLPHLYDRPMTADTCFYALTPDDHFLLGPLPGEKRVFVAALGGHGFKFAPALGEIMADLLCGQRPALDVADFSPLRFVGEGP